MAKAPTKARPGPTRKTAAAKKQPETTTRSRGNAQSVAEEDPSVSKGERASKQKALNNAVWRNAAPMGSRKRPLSPTTSQPAPTKKAKAAPVTRNTTASQVQATRKPPAVIASDSDDEEDGAVEDEPVPARPARASLKVKINKPEAYDDEDDTLSDMYQQSDEEEPYDDDDELEGLDPKSLVSTLARERPRWAAQNEDNLDVDDSLSAGGPDVTKDFEVNELDADEPFDIDGQYPGTPDDEEIAEHWSKRALARQAEVPRWNNNDAQATGLSRTPTTRSAPSNTPSINNNNDQWPAEAHYVPPQSGSRNISLTAQPPIVYTVIKAAIRRAIGDALFVDAYPPPASLDDYLRGLSMDIAEELEYDALYERLKVDTVLVEYIARLLSTRLSNVRCSAKKITLPKVETSFGLGSGAGLILRTKPFHHPIIISSIRECYFSAARGSMASKHVSRFGSTIDDGPLSMELEVPAPMLCMVATATYAAIEDWSTGYLKRSEFNSDAYEDVYRGHELFLENIRTNKRRAYHRLMADLYQEAAQSHAGHSAKAIANNSMAILDLAGMDE